MCPESDAPWHIRHVMQVPITVDTCLSGPFAEITPPSLTVALHVPFSEPVYVPLEFPRMDWPSCCRIFLLLPHIRQCLEQPSKYQLPFSYSLLKSEYLAVRAYHNHDAHYTMSCQAVSRKKRINMAIGRNKGMALRYWTQLNRETYIEVREVTVT